jgi:hypothetical protein
MAILGWTLIILGFPITPIVVNAIRHLPKNSEPGVGTQHISIIGMLCQALLIGSGIGMLLALR